MTTNEFIKDAIKLAIPMIILSVLQSSLGLIDQLMITDLGEEAITAVGISNQFNFLFYFLIAGLVTGVSIFVAQYIKQDRIHEIRKLLNISYLIAIVFLLPYFILSIFQPEILFRLFTSTESLIQTGVEYQKIVGFSIVNLIFAPLYVAILRSSRHTVEPLISGLFTMALNTFLNYCLIHGNFGFDAMGIRGAAIATTISRYVEVFILILLVARVKYFKYILPSFEFLYDKTTIKKFMFVVIPSTIGGLSWAFSEFLYAIFYSKLGDSALTAINITGPMMNILWGVLVAFANAFGIILGNTLGEGKKEEAYRLAKLCFPIAFVGALFIVGVILSIDSLYLSLYSDGVSEETRKLTQSVFYIQSAIVFVKLPNMVIGDSILKTGGKTHLSVIYSTLSIYLVGIPLAILATMVLKLDLVWAIGLISLEEFVRLSFGIKMVRSKRWINTL